MSERPVGRGEFVWGRLFLLLVTVSPDKPPGIGIWGL